MACTYITQSMGGIHKGAVWERGGGRQTLPLWLNLLALLIEIFQQTVIKGIEQMSCELGHACEDVSGTGAVLPSLKPGAKLTCNVSGRLHMSGSEDGALSVPTFAYALMPNSCEGPW